jgi:3-hydroxybutyryl-CoA dehydrogenase
VERIGVIGGGTMGGGIAAAFALGGHEVSVFEPAAGQRDAILPAIAEAYQLLTEEDFASAEAAETALKRIRIVADLGETARHSGFVVEAVPERLELKQHLFADLDRLCPAETILASNTSSLPLAAIMEKVPTARRAKVMVSHWYNPALLMPLVELSFFGNMSDADYRRVAAMHEAIGKRTVKVLKDVPGLVANRIQQGVAREVFALIEQEIASPEDIDRALKFGPAFRYATTGQLEVADLGGLDVWAAVGDNLLAVMDASRGANPMLKRKVAEGKLGIKSGEGFFRYDPATAARTRKAFLRRLVRQLRASSTYE